MTELEDINRLFGLREVYPPALQAKWLVAVRWLREESKRGWILDRRAKCTAQS